MSTASGAVHVVDDVALSCHREQVTVGDGVHRYDALRRDAEELRLLRAPAPPVVGEPWFLVLEPLGPDASCTARLTTPVVAVMEAP